MVKRVYVGALLAVVLVSGCATTRQRPSENEGLSSRVSVLENQLSQKDAELSKLRSELDQTINENRSLAERLALAEARAQVEAKKVVAPSKPEESDLK